ncbi:hypothetical protein [Duganella vulcania]|uniref:Uncharacterized protein n=1 Tax=Duganella vulcania TaxID=2692166 RepID=A0A845GZS5_9BURK|nr:hypothetical protein [Duganella vulcania]MYM97969.1 hypothetical protein [Duganella vulcania]
MGKEDDGANGLPNGTQMRKALEKSGYLFEQKIASFMQKQGFHVDSSWAFKDPEQEKSREIDVRAIRQVRRDEPNKLQVLCEFLMECKNSDSPLVFLQTEKNGREIKNQRPREYVFPIPKYQQPIDENSYTEIDAFIRLGLSSSHYYYSTGLKATQFAKIIRKGSDWHANHDGVYDSLILPQVKALEQRRKEVKHSYTKGQWASIWLFFNVIVLRDHLFVLDVNEPDALPVSTGRVSFVRHVKTADLDEHYLIDFVTEEYLIDYIKEVAFFAEAVAAFLPDAQTRLLNPKFQD